jgi:gamma-glutamylcyclotransferase (GGCT)/AIG2-like uncharacterized protein YtfP
VTRDSGLHSGDGQAGPSPASDTGEGHFHLFVYGTLRSGGVAAARLADCVHIADAVIEGTLYDLAEFPALMLYGGTPIRGEVWRCPVPLLPRLDEYEGVERGLFRRVAVMAGEYACWTYVAGPGIARHLTPDRRLMHGEWPPRALA